MNRKMQLIKRAVSVILSILTVLGCVPVSSLAQEQAEGGSAVIDLCDGHVFDGGVCTFCGAVGYTYDEGLNTYSVYLADALQSAVDEAGVTGTESDPATVRLMADMELTYKGTDKYGVLVHSGVMTLDLNGHVLSASDIRNTVVVGKTDNSSIWGFSSNGISLTLTDSSEEKTGGIENTFVRAVYSFDRLIIEDGNYSVETAGEARCIEHMDGTVDIRGGSFSAFCSQAAAAVYSQSDDELTISGGEFYGDTQGVYVVFANVSISGGTFSSPGSALSLVPGGIVTVTGGSFAGDEYDIVCWQTGFLGVGEGGIGAAFPGGFNDNEYTAMNDLLAEGTGYFDANGDRVYIPDGQGYVNTPVTVKCIHTADGSVPQTCQGYTCVRCGALFGEADTAVHVWKDGKCVCGEVCAHESYTDGRCDLCGIPAVYSVGTYAEDCGAEPVGDPVAVHGQELVVELENTAGELCKDVRVLEILIGRNFYSVGGDVTLENNVLTIPGEYITGDVLINCMGVVSAKIDLNGGQLTAYALEIFELLGKWDAENSIWLIGYGSSTGSAKRLFEKTGYTAGGVSVNGADPVSSVIAKEDALWDVVWTPEVYSVTWDAAGVTSVTEQSYNCPIVLPEDPTRPGYIFDGWFTSDGQPITGETIYTTLGESTYYAGWSQCSHGHSEHTEGTYTGDGGHSYVCTICGGIGTEGCHDYGFWHSDDGATCVAYCGICKADLETVTLVAPACKVYGDGNSCEVTGILNGSELDGRVDAEYFVFTDGEWVSLESAPVNAGTYRARCRVVTGDEFIDSDDIYISVEYTIAPCDLGSVSVEITLDPESFAYNGLPHEPEAVATVTLGNGTKEILTEGNGFTASYSDNTEVGYATVTLNGIGNYTGSANKTFRITDETAPTGEIFIRENSWKSFWNWASFGLFYRNSVEVSVSADGTGSGIASVGYALFSLPVADFELPLIPDEVWTEVDLDGNGQYSFDVSSEFAGAVFVKITDLGGNVAVINSDGIVVYEDCRVISELVSTTYRAGEDRDVEIDFASNKVSRVELNGAALGMGMDYTVSVADGVITLKSGWLDSLEAGTYVLTVYYAPMGETYVEAEGNDAPASTDFTLEVLPWDISGATVKVEGRYVYDGTGHTPKASVELDGIQLEEGVDYTLSYSDNVDAGEATVTVNGKGNYGGSVNRHFEIAPATLTGVSVVQKEPLVYNGGDQIAEVETGAVSVNGQPVTFTYFSYAADVEGWGGVPAFDGAGSYWVMFRATAPNHESVMGGFSVTIEKARVSLPEIEFKPYSGSLQTADVYDTEFYTVVENSGGVNAGIYDVVLKLKDTSNCLWENGETDTVSRVFMILPTDNEWLEAPFVDSWVYGEAPKAPAGKAKFGEVKIEYCGYANDGTYYESQLPPELAGSYLAVFTVEATENYGALAEYVNFEIAKANYDMSGAKWDYESPFAYTGNGHTVTVSGLPEGVFVESYAGNTGTQVGAYSAGAGLGYDRFNYNEPTVAPLDWAIVNEWIPTEFTVSEPNAAGWYNGAFEVIPNSGYTVSTGNTASDAFGSSLIRTGEGFANEVTVYLRNETTGAISLGKTLLFNVDKTAPTGSVELKERGIWAELVNTVTFGLFCSDEVKVVISAEDSLSGIAKAEYLESDRALTLEEVKAASGWMEYTGSFGVSPEDAKRFVYYVRITDKADNVIYISTDGAEYDLTAPVIGGAADGETAYTTRIITVSDKNLESVMVNGAPVEGEIVLAGNVNAVYSVVAVDRAGNASGITVVMRPLGDLALPLGDLTEENVTSDDREALEKVRNDLGGLDIEDATEEEKAIIDEILRRVDELEKVVEDVAEELERIREELGKLDPGTVNSGDREAVEELKEAISDLADSGNLTWDEVFALEEAREMTNIIESVIDGAGNAASTESTEKVEDVTAENVVPENREDLEFAKEDLEIALEVFGDNYTPEEKAALEEELARIEAALEILNRVKAVEELIVALPDSVEPDDEATVAAIEAAEEACSALSDYEKSLVDEASAQKLEKLLAQTLAYAIIRGDGASWTKGSTDGLCFTANGAYGKFTGLTVDGEDIDPESYSAVSGSTVITLKPSFLEGLKEGEHKLGVIYTDGETEGTFTVKEKPADPNTPATGYKSYNWLWVTVMAVSALGVAGVILDCRRRSSKGKR